MRILQFILLIAFVAVGSASAQTTSQPTTAADSSIVARINANGSVTVVQPDAMAERLKAPETTAPTIDPNGQSATPTTPVSSSGYRIQIYDSNARNAKQEALKRKRAVESRFGSMKGYVRFDSPYWRVRVGDFRNRFEAEHALAELRQAFPGFSGSFRIVRDRINAPTH